MNVLAGITGSSSGGLSIALQTLGADYLRMANEAGISPDLLHRVAVMSAGVFDSLPHCGAIITLLSICKLTHKQSYLNIAAMTIVIPLIALSVVIALGTMFGSFLNRFERKSRKDRAKDRNKAALKAFLRLLRVLCALCVQREEAVHCR